MDSTSIDIQASIISQQRQGLNNARQNLENAISTQEMQHIEQAAKEFEAVFLAEMLKPMFEGIKTDPMFGGGPAEDTYKSMMLQEYGKSMTESGGIGLASQVKAELIRIQQDARR